MSEAYGGLPTELSWKIFIDRYTIKDQSRAFRPGDLAVVQTNDDMKWPKKELARVIEIDAGADRIELELVTGPDKGQRISRHRRECDRPVETSLRQVAERIARGLAEVEPDAERRAHWQRVFADEIAALRVVPGGRVWAGAGTGIPLTLFNCYVLPNPKDSRQGIVETLGQMIEIMSRGGGVGINVSSLRPYRAVVKGVNGRSSGAVSWMELYSLATGLVEQGGSRRGALMLQLDIRHPDWKRFVDCKKVPGKVENANISLRITDEFMQAVKEDRDWTFWFPDTTHPQYDEIWTGDFDDWERRGLPRIEYETLPARQVWNEIIRAAWESAEPGVVFSTRHEKESNSWYFNPLICTNPCVTGDTLIYTDRGLRRATELFLEGAPSRVVVDGRLSDEAMRPASPMFMTGIKPVYRLVTREGYEIRLTADHQVMTDRGWVAARDLVPGDRVHILNRPGGFGDEGSYELGLVLGWLVGDGTLKQDRAVLRFFGEEKRELAPLLAKAVNAVLRAPVNSRGYEVGIVALETRDEARVQSERLLELAEEHGLLDHKASVPEAVFRGSREMQVGFLRALFSADGHVEYNRRLHRNVVLSSKHLTLLKDVQRLLLNFGIFSRIDQNRRAGGARALPDGRGGRRPYRTEPLHGLRITGASLLRFCRDIGFLHERKQRQLEQARSSYPKGPYAERFVAHFAELVPEGEEPVFDLMVPGVHAFTGNGIVVHNCAEQPLPAWGVCTLGHVNLARLYDARKGDVDWDQLRFSVRTLVRLLDNVIDATHYFFDENRENQMRERRIGAGTLG
ncbi:MAG TPA: LAGLIDADG family homing endonuclease, partial [Bacillota bacterium]